MATGKAAYLRSITRPAMGRSRPVGKTMEGATPPAVFIGSWNYPKVYAGPLVAPVQEECGIMDTPESWIPSGWSQEEILSCRLDLVRGKKFHEVSRVDDPFALRLQEVVLSSTSLESEVSFLQAPLGSSLSEEFIPFGPSAPLEDFHAESSRFEPNLERCYYDGDLSAGEAIVDLQSRGVPFSRIQKALSVGALGVGRKRRFVPSRWSITACDMVLADHFLRSVKRNSPIDSVRVHEFSSLNNHYAVILVPGPWQYEWMEAFLRVRGEEEVIFADHEGPGGKREYSQVGGCYYSCKMAVLEALAREGLQAGAIVLREARKGYIPLGVFNVRENVRHAMLQPAREFEDLKSALADVSCRMALPVGRFIAESTLLAERLKGRQATLDSFGKRERPGLESDPALPGIQSKTIR
ncbi:MAG: hypothetical protein NQU46_02870 [Methanolinea sp.]|nr:hypothetical protein [Methanolinea sp.]